MFGPFVEDWPQVALGFITQEVDDSSDPKVCSECLWEK